LCGHRLASSAAARQKALTQKLSNMFDLSAKPLDLRSFAVYLLSALCKALLPPYFGNRNPAQTRFWLRRIEKEIDLMPSIAFAATRALAFAAFATSVIAAAPAGAQQAAGAPPQGWFKVCAKQEDNDICNTQNVVTADSGQLLTAISLIDVKGKINRKIFQISVPSGRLIPPGVGLQIDKNKPTKVEYGICFPDRCIAEAQLGPELIAALKKGGELTVTSINFQNKPNPLKISLSGFAAALDGPGMQQSDLEDRNKKLEDAMAKKKAERDLKIKTEQDKAKAATP
jgi:invasion protein IalB